MKLLLVISSFAGGPGNVLSKIVRGPPSGAICHAIALMTGSEQSVVDTLHRYASFVDIVHKKYGADLYAFRRFLKLANKALPDCAISFDFASNVYCFGAFGCTRIPWIACVRGLESAFVPWRRWVEKIAFVFAKRIVVPSEAVKTKLIKYRIVPAYKIKVIPNGTPVQFNIRKMGLPSGTKTIGCVANFYSEIKGHRYAIDALKWLSTEFRLVIIGDGIIKDDMVRYAERLGVADRVAFLGYKSHDEMFDEMRKMDVLIIPSLSESFGLVAVEAMSVGLPVIASRVGGLQYIVDEGRTGYLIPPGNPYELALAVQGILSCMGTYGNMQRACLNRVKKYYSVDAMVDRYFELINNILTP